MTNEQLQKLTMQWSLELFNRPFVHKIVFNRRLKTTGGRYHLSDHHIDINPLMIEQFDEHTLKDVVLHELCHYHLHLTGCDYHHRSQDFKKLLVQVGGSRYAPLTTARQHVVQYQCQSCHTIIIRHRRFNTRRYVCGRCGGRLKEIE